MSEDRDPYYYQEKFNEKALLREISRRELYEAETNPALIQGLGVLGAFTEVPSALAYNFIAKQKGLPTKPIWRGLGTHEVTDPIELLFPSLIQNRTWNAWKLPINITSGVFLDPTTYMGVGLTDIGTISGRLMKSGFIPKVVGDSVQYVPRALKEGVKFGGALTADVASRVNHPQLWDALSKGGFFKEAIPLLPRTISEQVEQGLRGVKFGGQVVAPKAQAAVVRAAGDAVDNIGGVLQRNFPGLTQAFATRSGTEEMLRNIDEVQGSDMATAYRTMHGDKAAQYDLYKELKLDGPDYNSAIRAVRERQAAQRGMGPDEYLETLDEVDIRGLTPQESRQLSLYMQIDPGSARVKNGKIYNDVFDFKEGVPVRRSVSNLEFDPKFADEYREIVDVVNSRFKPRSMAQQTEWRAMARRSGLVKVDRSDYMYAQITRLPGKKEILRKSPELKILFNRIKGKSRSFRGPTVVDVNLHLNKQRAIMGGENYSNAEKAVAALVNDSRIAASDSRVSDVLKFYDTADLVDELTYRRLVKEAVEAGDEDYADVLKSTREFVREVRDLQADLAKRGKIDFANSLDNVNIGNLFNKADTSTIQNFYNFDIPTLDYFQRTKVDKEIRALNFFNQLFVDGETFGYSRLVPEGTTIDGYEGLGKYLGMRVRPEFARQMLGDAYQVGAEYTWALRKDIFDRMSAEGIFQLIDQPQKTFNSFIASKLFDMYKTVMRYWKETTLFPFPGYHFRNWFDNNVRVMAEYGIKGSGEFVSDLHESLKLLELTDLKPSGFKLGAIIPSGGTPKKIIVYGGKEMSPDEFLKEAMIRGVMGDGVPEFGIIGDDAIGTMRARIASMPSDDNNLKQHLLDLLENPRFEDDVPSSFKKGYRNLINKGIAVAQLIENQSRMQLFLKFSREMPLDEAAKRVAVTMIDYADLSKFERDFIQSVFPFYSFKKGAVKYLVHKYMESPAFFHVFRETLQGTQDFVNPDDQLNRAYFPEWLKESGIQIGMTDDGKPYVLNIRGLTTLAEITTFINPVQTLKESLAPGVKMMVEAIKNEDFYFKRPIESYPDERRLVLGFDIPTGGILGTIPALTKNIRAIRFIEDTSNAFADRLLSKMAGKEMSIFGRKGVKSFLGLGTVGTLDADTINTYFMKRFLGIPLYEIDVDKAITAKMWRMKDYEAEMGRGESRATKRYQGDMESLKKYLKRHGTAMDRYYQRTGRENLSSRYPKTGSINWFNLIGLDKKKNLVIKKDDFRELRGGN